MRWLVMATPADRRLLPEGRLAGPMPWVIAIMMFLTALSAAAGIGLLTAAVGLGQQLAGRVTVQIVDADPGRRDVQAAAVERLLARHAGVRAVHRVSDAEISSLLEPWLGPGGVDRDLPVPALIDADLADASDAAVVALAAALKPAAPAARIDRHAQWLASVGGVLGLLGWLAAAIVVSMAAATAAVVVLAGRGAVNVHRATIDIVHLLGATDLQIVRLFQRRIVLDALFGGLVGLVAAVAVLLLLGRRIAGIGSDLLAAAELPWTGWLILATLPLFGGLVAMVAARLTLIRALREML